MGSRKRKILLIGNPIAGKGKPKRMIRRLVEAHEEKGYEVKAFLTRGMGDAERLARDYGSDVAVIVIAGGDGTVHEVLNGLVDPSQTPLALLPLGTANILAHELGLPRDPEAVVRAIEEGAVRRIDMGIVDDRRFLMLVSAGFDAMVTEEVRRSRGARLGYGGYLLPVLKVIGRYRVPDLRVVVDETEVHQGGFVIVSNTRNYGGIFTVADRARCDSGHLDVCIFPKATVPALFLCGLAALRGCLSQRAKLIYRTAKRVRIESMEQVPVQVDGDPFGTTPVGIDLLSSAVPIVVPRAGRPQHQKCDKVNKGRDMRS